jgi:hypothetical protein
VTKKRLTGQIDRSGGRNSAAEDLTGGRNDAEVSVKLVLFQQSREHRVTSRSFRVKFVLVGGLAAIAHGAATLTGDVDICYARDVENLQRLAHALAPFHPRLRGVPPDLPFRLDVSTLRAGLNFTLTTDLADLDLLGEVLGLGAYDAVHAVAEEIEVYRLPCLVLTLEGLIRAKDYGTKPLPHRMTERVIASGAKQSLPETEIASSSATPRNDRRLLCGPGVLSQSPKRAAGRPKDLRALHELEALVALKQKG